MSTVLEIPVSLSRGEPKFDRSIQDLKNSDFGDLKYNMATGQITLDTVNKDISLEQTDYQLVSIKDTGYYYSSGSLTKSYILAGSRLLFRIKADDVTYNILPLASDKVSKDLAAALTGNDRFSDYPLRVTSLPLFYSITIVFGLILGVGVYYITTEFPVAILVGAFSSLLFLNVYIYWLILRVLSLHDEFNIGPLNPDHFNYKPKLRVGLFK